MKRWIGVGNEQRGDDGLGLWIARALRSHGLDAIESGGEAASLMEAWAGAEEVWLFDALQAETTPGAILRLEAHERELQGAGRRASSHGFGVVEAIELARALGMLPARLHLIGVVGKNFGIGDRPSPEVEASAAALVEEALDEALGPRPRAAS